MYCVKCGVRLGDGVKACPLCGTPVWDPGDVVEEKSYPSSLPRHHSESGLPAAVAMTVLLALAAAVVLIVCFRLYGELRWGGYVVFGIALFYVIAVLPLWFRSPRGEVFLPAAHAAAALYVLYICLHTGGHWFLSFALPVIVMSCLLSTALLCLLKYVGRGRLFILGGFFLLLGGAMLLIEFFEHITFGTQMFLWSLYPLACLGALGLFLLAAGMILPLREALEKRFFF